MNYDYNLFNLSNDKETITVTYFIFIFTAEIKLKKFAQTVVKFLTHSFHYKTQIKLLVSDKKDIKTIKKDKNS